MASPSDPFGLVDDTRTLTTAAARYHQRTGGGPWGDARARIRARLGIAPGKRVYLAGEQPLLYGGPLKVLGKLLSLAHLKRIDPECVTVFLTISSDAAKSNRECYRCFLPRPEPGTWHGWRKLDFHSGVPCHGTVIDARHLAETTRAILAAYGRTAAPEWLVASADPASPWPNLAELSRAFLGRLAVRFGLLPDLWLEDWEAEAAYFARDEEDVMARFLARWPALAAALDAERTALPSAPFWLIPAGKPRQEVSLYDGGLRLGRLPLTQDEVADGLASGAWRIALRAQPRVLALSLWADAQVSGSGSLYNLAVERAGQACGQPVMPRWRWPTDDCPAPPPPFGQPTRPNSPAFGMLDYLLTTDEAVVAQRLTASLDQPCFFTCPPLLRRMWNAMPHWSAEHHFQYMQAEGVMFAPRTGDGGAAHPWRDWDGSVPMRNPAREHRAFERYLQSQPAEYVATLERLCAPLAPMNAACRMVVLLPCRNEAQHVAGMLDLLAGQFALDGRPLARDSYEVLLLANTPAGEARDDTSDQARSWRHPLGMVLHVIDYIHPDGEPCPLTMARKILADLALLRAIRRGRAARPLYLACEDADILWMDPHQLALMIASLDLDPGLDGVRGQQDRCPWIMVRHPLLLLMRRSWNFTEAHMARRSLRPERNPDYDFNWNRVVASGWNTAISAEIYAQIGGYTRERRFEEDMDIGEKISCLRAYPVPGGMLPQVNTIAGLAARSEGSPRRWFYRFASGVEPYLDHNDYANFFGRDHERQVKTRTLDDFERSLAPVTALAPRNIPVLRGMLQKDFDFLIAARKEPAKAAKDYARVLARLGFGAGDVSLDGGRIELHRLDGPEARIAALAGRMPPSPVPAERQIGSGLRRSWHGVWGRAARHASAYRVGLIGCGRIVEDGHVPAYRQLPDGIAVVAVCDPSFERRRTVGDLLGIDPKGRFGDLDALLAEAELDAVVVASPTAFHADTIRRCLDHGLAVLCEKPLGVGAGDASSLLALAQAKGVALGTIHNYLASPLWRRGFDLLRSGRLGPPIRLRTKMAAPEALPGYSAGDSLWRHRRDAAGRGCLLDQGYHLFYLSCAIFGTPITGLDSTLSCSGGPGRDVDDFAELTLHHAGGGRTEFAIDWRAPALEPTVYVIDCAGGQIRLEEDEAAVAVTLADGDGWRESLSEGDSGGYDGSLGESLRRLAKGDGPVTPAAAGIEVLSWIDEAYRLGGLDL